MFSTIIKNEPGPIFRFFMDLGDAVTYIQKLNIPNGVVGACRLDSAYEHSKENPHLFQFVPNSKQVKAAKKLLKGNRKTGGGRIDGVPIFTAQNVDFAVSTPEGIKWYTPYFFDKSFLDSILEDSTDQHFDALIQSRRVQRRGDVIDDNFAAEVIEESADSIWEPGEVQDLMDEIGPSGIPFSVISKAAELQFSYAVDKMLLGNRWLRKATGIQPKFSYLVDSFERRSAVSQSRAFKIATCSANSDVKGLTELPEQSASARLGTENQDQATLLLQEDRQSPRRDWLRPPWLKPHCEPKKEGDPRTDGYMKEELENNPLLPRITFFGVEATEAGRMTKANVTMTMEEINKQMDEELNKESEQQGHGNSASKSSRMYNHNNRDPFFVATFGDYFSNMGRTRSPRRRLGIRR